MATRLFTKCVLIAAVAALAIALAPAVSLAQAKKQAAKMSPPPCTTGQTCAASCNQFKWCNVQWCTNGKWYPTLAVCYEGFCPAKC